MEGLNFDGLEFSHQDIIAYTEEDLMNESILYLSCCGSCKHFKYYLGSAGICLLDVSDKFRVITFKDIMDDKCEKWEVSDKEKEFYEKNKNFL